MLSLYQKQLIIVEFPVISCNKQGNDKADREAKTALYQIITNIKTGSIRRH